MDINTSAFFIWRTSERKRLLFAFLIFSCVKAACSTERHNFVLAATSSDEVTNCDIDCSKEPKRAICGSDGRTYASQCELDREICEGHPVRFKHPGECPESKRCHMERLHAQEMAQKPTAGVFIPDCEPDGAYASVQCHTGTGYCWCVTRNGRPIPGSSARFERPHCAHYLNANSHKRSSRGRKARRSCGVDDRQLFNRNMVHIFGSEYNRTQESRNATANISLDLRIVRWKFAQLDLDQNRALNKSELRDLRRMVKKIIRPRPCARTFAQYCDLDQNKNITQEEWTVCLGVTNTIGKSGGSPTAVVSSQPPRDSILTITVRPTASLMFTNKPPVGKQVFELFTRDPKTNRLTASWKSKFGTLDSGLSGIDFLQEVVPTNSSARKRDPLLKKKKPNCAAERSKVLLNKRRNPSATYVPECDASGNYAKVQCHAATGFCWCVYPENGKPISQTSRLNARPDCNIQRPLRGCPGARKDNFLANLTAYLIQEMTSSIIRNQSKAVDIQYTKNDALRWKFQNLDTNGNGILERSEWRPFKEHMMTSEGLRKCGRGYMRHCDTDDNKRISVEEWLRCATSPAQSERRASIHIKRLGPNPLEKYLKPD
ncbi:SPARC-related modular calcium-binding protein 1-like isoform X2 [Paramacrobiotus metropolitanus]|nr:SPARC-related modular calcium-binding protein 1-like isoform X2 [Paramacrobiotus metropolitanus]